MTIDDRAAAGSLRIVDGPSAQEQSPDASTPIRYEAAFSTVDGARIRRYLTDKGRAAMLRLLDEGRDTFSAAEIEELTVPATQEALLERTERESGDGA
jgi:hypothetical protein